MTPHLEPRKSSSSPSVILIAVVLVVLLMFVAIVTPKIGSVTLNRETDSIIDARLLVQIAADGRDRLPAGLANPEAYLEAMRKAKLIPAHLRNDAALEAVRTHLDVGEGALRLKRKN